ncbi:UNVERIFIED_ORG: hypothetical protein BDU10_2535 [Burkholderia sp. CF145]
MSRSQNRRWFLHWLNAILFVFLLISGAPAYAPPGRGYEVRPHDVETFRRGLLEQQKQREEAQQAREKIQKLKEREAANHGAQFIGSTYTHPLPDEAILRSSEFGDFRHEVENIRSTHQNLTSTKLANSNYVVRASADGRYLFLATLGEFFQVEPITDGSIPTFFAMRVPPSDWSITEALGKIDLGVGLVYEMPIAQKTATLKDRLRIATTFDERMLTMNNPPRELRDAADITVASEKPPPEMFKAKRFTVDDNKPTWYARIKGCCVYSGRPPGASFIEQLEKTPFDRGKVHVLNLYDNSGVINRLKTVDAEMGRRSVLEPTAFNSGPRTKIARMFSRSRGDVFAIIGHVVHTESEDFFVTRDARNHEIFRMPIPYLEGLAQRAGVNLLLLGCQTAPRLAQAGAPHTGTPVDIDAQRVAEQLSTAISRASDWGNFLEILSAQDLPLIVGKEFFVGGERNQNADGLILNSVDTDRRSDRLKVIGRFWFRFRCGFFAVC